jgi:hypothetical protein
LVRRSQRRLNRFNEKFPGNLPQLNVDGIYGIKTATMVSRFQLWLEIETSGVIDGLTAAELRNFIPHDHEHDFEEHT